MMAIDTNIVVDPKTTGMMLYRLCVLSSNPEPFCLSASLNQEKLPFSHRCVSMRIPDVLDLLTEVIIIPGWSNWIPTQSINISMSETWSVYYLEAKVL
jgi:hypothetical protein